MNDGVIIIDKPEGWTSHDVVAKVKKTLRAKKVGHLGTLDPIATGVLPLVVNGATRYARILEGGRKVYHAAMKIGETTDTYDSEGKVIEIADYSSVTADDVNSTSAVFKGKIMQVPPMYSSVKRNGVPLYKLARKGLVVDREPKEVEIISLEVVGIGMPNVEFMVTCSRGTYVRSLCNDIGSKLGCGAHMTWLRRHASGEFTLDEAVSPTASAEVLSGAMIPLGEALARVIGRLNHVDVNASVAAGLKNSTTVTIEGTDTFFTFLKPKEMVRFTACGRLAAVAEFLGTAEERPDRGVFHVLKVFKPGSLALEALGIENNRELERVC